MTKHAAPSTRRSNTCLLLNLPPELHNKIWECVLVQDTTILLAQHRHSDERYHLKRLPDITQASRQTRAETLPVFIGRNTFRTAPDLRLRRTPKNRAQRLYAYGPLSTHLTHLRTLEISACLGSIYDQCYVRLAWGAAQSWVSVRMTRLCGDSEEASDDGETTCSYTDAVAAKVDEFIADAAWRDDRDERVTAEELFVLAKVAAGC